jgi:PST family polysaccharide transporter
MTGAVPRASSEPQTGQKSSYGQILKSSALVGGSQAANIVIRIARAKAMALLLGPSGVGLAGLYSSILDLTTTVAGMGVNSSGVRQIAAAVGTGDTEAVARTTFVLRRISILLGLLGAAALILFSSRVSRLTFGTPQYAGAICLLSAAVLFTLVSNGQGALIQGMRRIADLAKMNVWAGFLGAVVTISVVYFWREEGIVPALVCGAAISIALSWRYSRKIRVKTPHMPLAKAGQDVSGLLKLGLAFMASSVLTMGSAYLIRIIVLRKVGLEGAGLYQAAWTLGGLYVGFILQAMAADFYPRLTACANDNATCNRLVNEQTLIGLLLGGPGVLATLTLAPLVVTVFYTAKFAAAVELLRWFCLGTMLQVISWPMGYIILAKGRQNIFLLSDLAWTVIYLAIAYFCVRSFGLSGAGIAFFVSYVVHLCMTYVIVRSVSGFRWSWQVQYTGLATLLLAITAFGLFRIAPFIWATSAGILIFLAGGWYATRMLLTVISPAGLPQLIRLSRGTAPFSGSTVE